MQNESQTNKATANPAAMGEDQNATLKRKTSPTTADTPSKTQKLVSTENDLKAILLENNQFLREQQKQFLDDLDMKFGAKVKGLELKIDKTNSTALKNEESIKSSLARINELEINVTVSTSTSSRLEERLLRLEEKADKSERIIRRNDIIISNLLSENPSKVDWYTVLAMIGNHLKVEICNTDIAFLKVLNNENRLKNLTESDSMAPHGWYYTDLLVKFHSTITKSNLFKAYMEGKNLSNRNTGLSQINARVYINDNLTIPNFGIYKKANALFKVRNNGTIVKLVKSVYIYRGLVYVRPHNSDTGICVTSLEQLSSLHAEIIKKK